MPVALVTGAARGLGEEICRQLAMSGWHVYVSGRRIADAEAAAHRIGSIGPAPTALELDVSSTVGPANAAARISAEGEVVDLLVNNAGVVAPIGAPHEVPPADWARAIEINLIGAFRMFTAFRPLLAQSAAPTLINLSSGAASRYMRGWSAYCCSKAGLAMLTQALHADYAGGGLAVYELRPGLVDTGMQAQIRDADTNEISRIPQEDLLPAAVPAQLALWLATERPADLRGTEVDIRDERLRERARIAAPKLDRKETK